MMKRKAKKSRGRITRQVRAAIRASGLSQADLCRRAGLEEAALSRFLSEKTGLTLASVDRLAEVLDLDLVSRKPSKRKGRRSTKGG